MRPDCTLAPTVEYVKLCRGRGAFHDSACYDIGPYASIKQYVLAYYDKEIYYYSNAPHSAFNYDTFDLEPRADFVQRLKVKRTTVKAELEAHPRQEPFVLCHGGLQGRNFMMRGMETAASFDWEFAGSFPLCELFDSGVEVLEMADGESTEECFRWCNKISKLVEVVVRERQWSARDLELLMSDGDPVLQSARVEMLPEHIGGSEANVASKEE